jgi:hypothetical protein
MCVSNSSRVTRHAPVHAEISPFGAVSGCTVGAAVGVPLPLGPAVEPPAEEPDELSELVEVLSADVVPGVPGSPVVPAAPAVASAV